MGYQHPLKNATPIFLLRLLLILKTVQASFLYNFPYIMVFCEPFLKSDFSVNPITLKFFIKPHLILNVTKFFVKISQFKFLVVTEKNIFVYKPYLSLNNSDFTLFFNVKTAGPP